MLLRKEPETAPLCPQCGDAMRLARKLPPVRPLSGLVVHLCGRCGYVEPVSVSPSRHHRNGFNRNVAHDIPYFVPALGSANDLRRHSTSRYNTPALAPHSKGRLILCTVPGSIPNCLALRAHLAVLELPRAFLMRCSSSGAIRGRPSCLPSLLARLSPAWMLS